MRIWGRGQKIRYGADHWIRSEDCAAALARYDDQQRKAYNRVKNLFISELMGDLRGKRVLDYGCGAGFFVVHAARCGARRVVGVDAEATVLATAAHFLDREGLAGPCELIHSELLPPFCSGESFDVILMKDVIEHVNDDDSLLVRARESIAPGGTLIISTQNSRSLNYFTEGIYHRCLRGEKHWYGWDETHLRFYTFRSLAAKLRRTGWLPREWRGNYLIPHKYPVYSPSGGRIRRWESLSRVDIFLGRYFPWNRLGWNIIVESGPAAR